MENACILYFIGTGAQLKTHVYYILLVVNNSYPKRGLDLLKR